MKAFVLKFPLNHQNKYLFQYTRQHFYQSRPYLFLSYETYKLLSRVLQIEDLQGMRDYLFTVLLVSSFYA